MSVGCGCKKENVHLFVCRKDIWEMHDEKWNESIFFFVSVNETFI